MNNLYELGGIGDVFIINKIDLKLGKNNYKAGEVYTVLKDVNINFQYEQNNSLGKNKENKVQYVENYPSSISISNIDMTDKIYNLLMKRKEEDYMIITKKEIITCEENNTIYLSENPLGNIYVKNNKYENLFFTQEGQILKGDFVIGEQYLIFYNIQTEQQVFSMKNNSLPYFSLEIHFKGNKNKETYKGYLLIPSVSLTSSPVIVFDNNSIIKSVLNFTIIQVKDEEILWGI